MSNIGQAVNKQTNKFLQNQFTDMLLYNKILTKKKRVKCLPSGH